MSWIELSAAVMNVMRFIERQTDGDSDAGKANVTEGSNSPEGRVACEPASETELGAADAIGLRTSKAPAASSSGMPEVSK